MLKEAAYQSYFIKIQSEAKNIQGYHACCDSFIE